MIMVFFSRYDTITPPTAKLDIQADVLLLIGSRDFETARKDILAVIPSYLEVAEDKVRIGVYDLAEARFIEVVGLTGNEMHFTKTLQEFKPMAHEIGQFEHVQISDLMKIFNTTGRHGIPKVVHLFSNQYVPVTNPRHSKRNCYSSLQLHDTQTPDNFVHGCDDFGEALMNALCGQGQEACTFDKSGACIAYRSGIIPFDPLECGKFPDLKPMPCNKTCDVSCADLKAVAIKVACSGKCGKTQIDLTSTNITEFLKKTLSRCPPHFREFQCEACTGTAVPETSGDSFPVWAIVVIVAVVAIALLGIIVAVVISRRRRMQKKPAPVSVKTSGPVAAPKVKVVVKGRKGVGAAIGGESEAGKGEESVGVSMKENLTTKSQKPAGSFIKSFNKGKDQVSKKSSQKSNRSVSKMGKGPKIATGPKKA